MDTEIKPSFSMKYFVLTVVTTLIISGIGLGLSKLYESNPKKQLEINTLFEMDLLNNNSLPNDQIEAKYFLKGASKKEISSLFKKKVSIKNNGNEGVEDLLIFVTLIGKNTFLISQPLISTSPKKILDAIEVDKIESLSNTRHKWKVSLLNPGESINFEYTAYSEEKVDELEIHVQPRKKSWTVINMNSLQGNDFSSTFVITSFVTLAVMLLLSQLLYVVMWFTKESIREKYVTFYNFWKKWPIK